MYSKKLICIIALILAGIIYSPFFIRAETIELIPRCSGNECLSNPTDIAVSNDGSFFLIVDSDEDPYVRKVGFSSGVTTDDTVIPLGQNQASTVPQIIGISKDDKKAFVLSLQQEETTSERVLLGQANQGTDCKCPTGTFFDETLCVTGTLDCTNTASDSVCSCDNLNFLNSCVARANGVKKYTKGTCGSNVNLSCTTDDQCPLGSCPNGKTFKRFTCTLNKCTAIVFSTEPCSIATGDDCRCLEGSYFDGMDCVTGTLDCENTASDSVCSCDNLNFLNSCVARANGVKKFTKGPCGSNVNLSCTTDDQCPLGSCPDGDKFDRFTCSGGRCEQIVFSSEPCSSSTNGSSSSSSSIIHIINLTNNSVMTFSPSFADDNDNSNDVQTISTVAFLDSEGKELIASNDDSKEPKLLLIDSETGNIKGDFSLAGVAKSIELSPTLNKAIVTFKDTFAQSIGILNSKTKEVIKFDTPNSIFFAIDEFLSMVDFDLSGNKVVVSSLGGKHVLHLLDMQKNKLTIKFLDKDAEGQTLSTISSDGTTAVSVGNDPESGGIVVYKLNTSNVKLPRVVKSVSFNDDSEVLDVLITPDNDKAVILVQKEGQKILKLLRLTDLSLVCEFEVSGDTENTSLYADPYGRYYLTPNFDDNSVSIVSNLQTGPVFRSISPLKGTSEGGTQFTIDGFIDPSLFTEDVKVCFGNSALCSSSTMISDDGFSISGITPKFMSKGILDLILIAEEKLNTAASSSGICPDSLVTKSRYKKVFKAN